jgi:hypothetical protein
MIMKKEYIIPKVETVHPNLKGSILEDVNINLGSGAHWPSRCKR